MLRFVPSVVLKPVTQLFGIFTKKDYLVIYPYPALFNIPPLPRPFLPRPHPPIFNRPHKKHLQYQAVNGRLYLAFPSFSAYEQWYEKLNIQDYCGRHKCRRHRYL